jgi:hypothetical protein
MARFADKLYFDKQKIDAVESALLLSLRRVLPDRKRSSDIS